MRRVRQQAGEPPNREVYLCRRRRRNASELFSVYAAIFMKKIISAIIILIIIVIGFYFLSKLVGNDELEQVEFDNQSLDMPEEPQQPEQQDWSQLRAEILQPGQGEGAQNGQKLTVHYVGVLEDGTKFDSSVDRGQPFQVTLGAGQVIQGWELGLVGMKKGEIRRLFIPSQLGYGEQGAGQTIPANANLIFEIQLLEIE